MGKILDAWKRRPIVWLSGVRRSGKTTLARMIPGALYLNCDLPSTAQRLSDPEMFFDSLPKGTRLILDEIHRLEDPSRLLKIAADEYSHLRVLATGSSTLAATHKFRDSLTGRKETLYLPPVLWTETRETFGIKDLDRRFLHGGLPEALLRDELETSFFSEWMDSYYARDIQELFHIRSRTGFLKLLHLLLHQSGGLLDYTKLSKESELSRPTVKSHLDAMQLAHAVFLLPPFFGGGRREIVHRPKCYGFDTGMVCQARGWDSLRNEDRGLLWEHLALDTLRTAFPADRLHYWRDKSDRELDFVVPRSSRKVDIYECKYNPTAFQPEVLAVFRKAYPEGENYVLSPGVKTIYTRRFQEMEIRFIPLDTLLS